MVLTEDKKRLLKKGALIRLKKGQFIFKIKKVKFKGKGRDKVAFIDYEGGATDDEVKNVSGD